MIITCPNCAAEFIVESRLIPAAGRKLKCKKCEHTWHFIAVEDVHTATPYARFGAALDALRRQHEGKQSGIAPLTAQTAVAVGNAGRKAFVLSALFAKLCHRLWQITTPLQRASLLLGGVFGLVFAYVFAFMVASRVVESHSAFSPVFNILGVSHSIPGEGLVLQDLRLKPVQTAKGEKRLEIFGSIHNRSLIPRNIPIIEAYTNEANGLGNVVRMKLPQAKLETDKSIPFSLTFLGWPPKDMPINIRFYLP